MQPTTELKAIETVYHGFRFRSRLEAKWTVFFDVVGFRYLYEPEGYELNGIRYLPDFKLLDAKVFAEIKPNDPTAEERQKAYLLAAASRRPVWVISGQPYVGEYRIWVYGGDYQDCSPCWFTQCKGCIRIVLESACCCGFCCTEFEGNAESPRLLAGYEAARKARFEGKDDITLWPGPLAMVQANELLTDSEIWLTNRLYTLGGLGTLDDRQRWQMYSEAKKRRDMSQSEKDALLAALEI